MKYVVFGTGGAAKELIGYVLDDGHEVVLAVSTEPFNNPAFDIPVVEKLEYPEEDWHYLMGVSEPALKRKFVAGNLNRWVSFVHSTAYVSRFAKVGRGCILTPQVTIVGDAALGDFVFINTNGTVGHDSTVGSYTCMMPNTEVCGNCVVGEDVFMGIGSYVLPGKKVGDGAKISAGSVIRNDVAPRSTV
jgi:sugar O-acyltransferase (sialic acid O-acetyltransferase NeuD family)